jgi:uncharacterized membrane protein YfcA
MLTALVLVGASSMILATATKLHQHRFREARSLAVVGFMIGLVCAISLSFADRKLFVVAAGLLTLLIVLGILANRRIREPG